jgi:hypothetical protein
MHTDPLLALMERRGELNEADIDEMEARWEAGSHLTKTSEADNTDVIAGAAPYELMQFEYLH